MKLSNLLSENMDLFPVLQRLGVKLGFGEASVDDICERYGFSRELFDSLCDISTKKNFVPSAKDLRDSDMPFILQYLRSSHEMYRNILFPSLHKMIHELLSKCDPLDRQVLNKFYDEYDAEVIKHFEYEDELVFPYIEGLLSGKTVRGFSIKNYEANHTDIETKLDDLKNILIKYLPEDCPSDLRYRILLHISHIETDHGRHTVVENSLMVPLAGRIEKENAKKK